jgi:hypothetical protein
MENTVSNTPNQGVPTPQPAAPPKPKFPTEIVDLPSKGLLYPKDNPLSSGKIEMKYMTAKEEDILTNQNYIRQGVVVDKLLESLIVSDVNYDDVLIGDKNAVLIASRILGYGQMYKFDYAGEKHEVDLTKLENQEIDENLITPNINQFDFTLPHSGNKITFKILSHGDEKKIEQELKGLKKINKNASPEMSLRYKHMITSINGDDNKGAIREFVDNMFLARDSKAFRDYMKKVSPDIILKFWREDWEGNDVEERLPIGANFFFPDAD